MTGAQEGPKAAWPHWQCHPPNAVPADGGTASWTTTVHPPIAPPALGSLATPPSPAHRWGLCLGGGCHRPEGPLTLDKDGEKLGEVKSQLDRQTVLDRPSCTSNAAAAMNGSEWDGSPPQWGSPTVTRLGEEGVARLYLQRGDALSHGG